MVDASGKGVIKVQATSSDTGIVSNTLVITISNQSIKVTGIKIDDPGTITSIAQVQLTAVTSPAGASVKSVKWTIDNKTGSATISDDGKITAQSDGIVSVKAIATALDGTTVSDTRDLTISGVKSDVAVTSISAVYGENKATSINKDDGTLQMYATVLPSYASTTSAAVKWTVSGGATISDTGVLKAVSDGKVTVRAACKTNPAIYKEVTIWISHQITQVTDIAITSPTVSVAVGGTLQMSASVLPTDASYPNVTWKVESGTGTADINPSSGLLTGKSAGDVTVVAVADNGTGKTEPKTITITPKVNVSSITVNPATGGSISTAKGTLQMSVTVNPSDATNQLVTWSVEQAGDTGTTMDGKASITQDGLLTATQNGQVKVRATSKDNPLKFSESIIQISGQPVLATGLLIKPFNVSDTSIISADDGTLELIAGVIPTNATTTPASVIWTIEPYAAGPQKSSGNAGFTTATPGVLATNATTSGTTSVILQGVSNGDVKVKATGTTTEGTVINGEYIVSLSGQVLKATTITINKPNTSITKGNQVILTATILPTNATTKTVKWSIVPEAGTGIGTATIGLNDGSLMGITPGVVNIKATVIDEAGNEIISTTTPINII